MTNNDVNIINKAKAIAEHAHRNQKRWCGAPYITHPAAVAERVADDPDAVAVAWLHDTLEDTTIVAESLLADGIPPHIVDAVKLLTHMPNEDYFEYIDKISNYPKDTLVGRIALKVKLADILHNISDKMTKRRQMLKYAYALQTLLESSNDSKK